MIKSKTDKIFKTEKIFKTNKIFKPIGKINF